MLITKNKNTYKLYSKYAPVLTVFVFVVAFFLINLVWAADDQEETQEELETLEQKAQNYQRMINLKQQQQMSLNNQLQMMDIQIESFNNDIQITKEEIEKNTIEIKEIQSQVDQKQAELDKSKSNLAEMIRLFHQIDQEIGMEFMAQQADLSSVLNQSEYIDQASQKIDEVLRNLKIKKAELEEKHSEFRQKNNELTKREQSLKEKITYASSEKLSKSILLEKTQGEEEKYKNLLERVEEQKQELIGDLDELSSEKRSELDSILNNAPKPSGGKASTSWYYAQDDNDWAYKRIGLSSSLMKDYGCAVTALSMVFTYHGEKITPGKLSSQPIFYRDLIVWPQHWKSLELDSSTGHGNIDWGEVKKQIKKDRPVIVFVRASGGKGHYVVIHGRDKKGEYVVHDPLFGPNIYLKTTQKLIGTIYNSSTTIDQMLIYKD